MPIYDVTIDGVDYEVESPTALSPQQAYEYAKQGAPQKSPPNSGLDPAELSRLGNAEASRATIREDTPSPQRAANNATAAQIKELEAQRDDLYRAQGIAPVEKSRRIREYQAQIATLKNKLPTDWADVGGLVLGTGGAVGGAALGTVGTPGVGTAVGAGVGAAGGGFVGRLMGALVDVNRQQMKPAEAMAYMEDKLSAQRIMLDAGGNILFIAGGQVLTTVAKNTSMGRALIKALGGTLSQAPNADKTVRGKGIVFSDTTEAEAQAAAEEAVRRASQGKSAYTAGQQAGEAGFIESRVKQVAPQPFKRANETVEAGIEGELDDLTKAVAGAQTGKTGGHTLEKAINTIDNHVSSVVQPVYRDLHAATGDAFAFIDVSAMRAAAQAALAKDARGRTLSATERTFYEDIVARGDKIDPDMAHTLQSTWSTRARDLNKAAAPDTELQRVYATHAQEMRNALAGGLDDAAKNMDAQASLFREGGESAGSLAASQRAEQEARAAGDRLRAQDVDIRGPDLFDGRTNVARAEAIGRADSAATAAADGAATRAYGPAQQKSMFADAPKVDPRLPARLREASALYREMNDNVYSTMGVKALRAADSRGPEHVGAQIYQRGNVTAVEELNGLAAFGDKLEGLPGAAEAKKAAAARAKALGIEILDGQPIGEAVREAQRGFRAEYLRENVSNVEALRGLPEKMKKPAFRRTFEAAFPNKADQLVIERLSQAAQLAGRAGESGGMPSTVAAGLGGTIGFFLGGPLGASAGMATMYFGPRALAHVLTSPKLVVQMPRVTSYLLRTAQGGGATVVPDFVKVFVKDAAAEGVDLLTPEK